MSDMRSDTNAEFLRLRYSHVENLVALAIVGVITLGGFVCMVTKVEGGQTIVVGVLALVTGWIGGKKSIQRSGR
jgi:hypothetical protein